MKIVGRLGLRVPLQLVRMRCLSPERREEEEGEGGGGGGGRREVGEVLVRGLW